MSPYNITDQDSFDESVRKTRETNSISLNKSCGCALTIGQLYAFLSIIEEALPEAMNIPILQLFTKKSQTCSALVFDGKALFLGYNPNPRRCGDN